jgi:hypothetical protein
MDYDLIIIVVGSLWLIVICLVIINFHLNQHSFYKHLTCLQIENTKLRSDLDKVTTSQAKLQIELNLALFKITNLLKETDDADSRTEN